jgi:hypothetical protein
MGPKASSAMGYGWFYNCNNLEFIGERAFNFQNLTGYLYAFGQTGSYQTYGTFGCSNLPSKIRTYSKDFIYAPNASYISYSISENDPAIYGSFVNNRANFLGGAFTARGSQTFAFGVSSSKSLAQNGAFYNNNSTFQKESFLSLENSTLQFAGFPFSSANVNFLEGCFTSKDSSFFSIVGHYNFHGGGPIFSPGCFKAEDTASVTIKSTYTGGVFGSFTNNSYYSTVNAGMFDFGPNITLVSVAYAFYNLTQITGALPEWWNRDPAPTDYNNCFYGCTSASNFSSVPSSWL